MVCVLSLKQKILSFYYNVFSEVEIFNYVVPQGSNLAAPLFLLYGNGFPQSSSVKGSYLNADDTCIFYQHEDVQKLKIF